MRRAITVFADFCASTISAAAAAFAVLANLYTHQHTDLFVYTMRLFVKSTNITKIHKKHEHHKDPQKARALKAIHKKQKHHKGPPS